MSFLSNPHLDLTTVRIETPRCVLVPFSLDGVVDIHELTDEFCRANWDFQVAPILPTYEQEYEYVRDAISQMEQGQIFENFIIDKVTGRLFGAIGLTSQEEYTMNIGFWIRVDEQGKGYATEAYTGLLQWSHENTIFDYLKHSMRQDNIASRRIAEKFGGVLQDEKTDRGNDRYHVPLR